MDSYSTGYSQLLEILCKFAFVRDNPNQLEAIESPHGSSRETRVIYASK